MVISSLFIPSLAAILSRSVLWIISTAFLSMLQVFVFEAVLLVVVSKDTLGAVGSKVEHISFSGL
jgi:hypothetical protein